MKTTKWHKLGQKLGVEKFDLDVIQKDNPQNTEGALEAMLKKWLEITKYSTWRAIVDALETIEERQLAKKLETQFCPGMCSITSLQLRRYVQYSLILRSSRIHVGILNSPM